jgi:hypothetical protein
MRACGGGGTRRDTRQNAASAIAGRRSKFLAETSLPVMGRLSQDTSPSRDSLFFYFK